MSNISIDSLHFKIEQLNDWMLEAILDPKKQANQIKTAPNLVPKTYVPTFKTSKMIDLEAWARNR